MPSTKDEREGVQRQFEANSTNQIMRGCVDAINGFFGQYYQGYGLMASIFQLPVMYLFISFSLV
jgi:hypothetical protein